jgi:hypothetical protein
MKLPIKLLEISFCGTYSLLGAIYEELKEDITKMNDYCWILLINQSDMELIRDQCKALNLTEWLIVERRSAFTSFDK